jgi:glutamine amidotransferase
MVHRSLVAADNALGTQSERHPDGWGVAYYVDGAPHLMRSADTALHDHLFHRVSGIVSSETVVAHVRKATVGPRSVLNSHPFQHGRWVFAHNGTIHGFDRSRAKLEAEIAPRLRRFILGDTDSEVAFFLFLTRLEAAHAALSASLPVELALTALEEATATIRGLCDDGQPALQASLLTFVASNGEVLVAVQGGRELFWSSYKTRCADRDVCPHLSYECEHPAQGSRINHLIVSSEPLGGENIWIPMSAGEAIGVDSKMHLVRRGEAVGGPLVQIGAPPPGAISDA